MGFKGLGSLGGQEEAAELGATRNPEPPPDGPIGAKAWVWDSPGPAGLLRWAGGGGKSSCARTLSCWGEALGRASCPRVGHRPTHGQVAGQGHGAGHLGPHGLPA